MEVDRLLHLESGKNGDTCDNSIRSSLPQRLVGLTPVKEDAPVDVDCLQPPECAKDGDACDNSIRFSLPQKLEGVRPVKEDKPPGRRVAFEMDVDRSSFVRRPVGVMPVKPFLIRTFDDLNMYVSKAVPYYCCSICSISKNKALVNTQYHIESVHFPGIFSHTCHNCSKKHN